MPFSKVKSIQKGIQIITAGITQESKENKNIRFITQTEQLKLGAKGTVMVRHRIRLR